MKAPVNLRSGETGFNMTPMIDVVFLLIIFFLVSSHLAKREAQMKLDLPVAVQGENDEDTDSRMTVNVLPNGDILTAGRQVPATALTGLLREKAAIAGEDLEVRIRSDRTVAYEKVEAVMRACTAAGVWNVTIAVVQQKAAKSK